MKQADFLTHLTHLSRIYESVIPAQAYPRFSGADIHCLNMDSRFRGSDSPRKVSFSRKVRKDPQPPKGGKRAQRELGMTTNQYPLTPNP